MNAYFDARFSDLRLASESGLTAHLLAVGYFVQRKVMERLLANDDYKSLNLAHEPYFMLLAERTHSPSEIADKLGISKQACSKAIRELETLGFIARRKNPDDSRSSLMSLSHSGLQLVQRGIDNAIELEAELTQELGLAHLEKLNSTLKLLCAGLGLQIPNYQKIAPSDGSQLPANAIRLNILLPLVNKYCFQALIANLGERGFAGLRPNFSYVMSLIIPDGGRIQHIATVVGVSKQAIAAIATELEELGYIARQSDPQDKRQVILRLSEKGQRLIDASDSSIAELENTLNAVIGNQRFTELQRTLDTLFRQVANQEGSQRPSLARIQQRARSLLEELGPTGAQLLAQQLIELSRGEV